MATGQVELTDLTLRKDVPQYLPQIRKIFHKNTQGPYAYQNRSEKELHVSSKHINVQDLYGFILASLDLTIYGVLPEHCQRQVVENGRPVQQLEGRW
jgi:hypothetical protein